MMNPELDKALRCLYIAAEEPAAREVNRLARVEIEKLEAAVRDADKLLKAYEVDIDPEHFDQWQEQNAKLLERLRNE
jgi:hypothetical protein